MELYGKNSKSIPQKIIINILELLILWLSYWILFQDGGFYLNKYFHIQNSIGYLDRRIIIFSFNIIIFIRLAFMMIVFLKRKIPWQESVSVPFAFALYYIGFSILVLPTNKTIDWIDILAIFLFLFGCYLNSWSEYQRNKWKFNTENKGRIYTEGLFKYSRHINYFGDILWVTAYSVITRNWYSITLPIFIFCFFAFYNAPKLDNYLKSKYGNEYDEYAKKTKMLIPFLY